MSWWNQTSSQRHGQRNEQKLIQDQNFSNEIFFGLLSTIESIAIHHQGKGNYHNKIFKAYDRVNYSTKSIHQLRSQLQSQIMLFQASRKVFLQENPKLAWQLPNNFNQQQAQSFLQQALQIFQQYHDEVSYKLTEDAGRLLSNQLDGLYSEGVNLKVNYSEQERKGHRKDLFTNGVQASQHMDRRAAEVKDLKNRNELSAHINHQSNSGFTSQGNMVTRSKINQSPDNKQKGRSRDKHNDNPSTSTEKKKMDIQGQKQDWSYLALYSRYTAENIVKGYINYKSLYKHDYKFFQTMDDVMKVKQDLLQSRHIYLVPVQIDKYKDAKKIKSQILDLSIEK